MPIATPQGTLDFKSVDKVTFVGASSNTVIDTTTGSLGVGVGVGGPTSNLHVVGDALISSNLTVGGNVSDLNVVSNVNMLHTSNTASIKLNSNVVAEFPRSKKLIKYPRVALTQNTLNNGYAAEASTENNGTSSGQAYRVFDGLARGERGYHSVAAMYTSGSTYNGSASITDAHGTQHQGEWIKLQMPTAEKMKLSGFSFSPRVSYYHRVPYKGVFLGSTNGTGTNWYPIHYFDNFTVPELTTVSRTFENNTNDYYNHIALVAYEVGPDATFGDVLNFAEMELFGVPEYDPEADGVDVVVKSLPNVPNTDWLEVYYDAKNYSGSGDVQDLSTNSFNGTLTNGASYNNSDGIDKFVFDAGTNQYMTTTTNISGSEFIHTTSMWVKFVEVSTDSNDQHFLFNLGAWGSNSIGMYYSANQGIRVAPTGFDYRTQYHPVAGKWFHVSYTYAGGAHGTTAMNTTVKFYINGQQWGIPAYYGSTSTITLPSSSVLQINGSAGNNNTLMDVEVANFRLFNRALTSDEIYQLYAYQKEDFGHGDLSMTLKAGRLGIGTSEPRVALDVAGGMMSRGMFAINQTHGQWYDGTALRFLQNSTTNFWDLGSVSQADQNFAFAFNRSSRGYFRHNGGNVNQNFTGQHRTFIKDVPFSQAGDLEGLIVSSDQNKYIKMSGGIEAGSNAITTNESLPIVSLSNIVTDKKCFGVISASEDPEQREDEYGSFVSVAEKEKGDTRVYINSVGEGAIWVSNIGGSLESGDYITTSNIVGYGQKQEGAGLMNYTVAKITMDCDFEPTTQPIQIIKKDETGENVLDEHDQIQWEDHPTETEKAYKIKYLDASGVETDEANAVHIAAFAGCTYHCG